MQAPHEGHEQQDCTAWPKHSLRFRKNCLGKRAVLEDVE